MLTLHECGEPANPAAPTPFDRWGPGFIGPLPKAPQQRRFVFIAVDLLSKRVEADAMADLTADRVASFASMGVACRSGVPKDIQANVGAQFASSRFIRFRATRSIGLKFTSVAHPQANGLTGVTNRTIIRAIERRLGEAKGP